ncbi:hypothetical protein [Sphingobacterium sp. JUb56]|uniref:hypothetical protein n=1 Tax=Sphingobacterium sp. JUb56 TaxID=2587145 RepID=UPI00160911D9|nr:hypothetical protein [Sphingobacterium sp. JUb56]MBB2953347.1 hypothetical protein [Sphingobacterium sp. JUb56]
MNILKKDAFLRLPFVCGLLLLGSNSFAQQVVLKNDKIQRTLTYDGQVWRTTSFTDMDHKRKLKVTSDEIHILPMETTKGYSIDAFIAVNKPKEFNKGDTCFVEISYRPKDEFKQILEIPQELKITYFVVADERFSRKKMQLSYARKVTVDRLEVERMYMQKNANGGGRGEPVFIDNAWFFGLEYPAGHSRHTDGNLPKADARNFEKVGNYSFIDLEGRDIEPETKNGAMRLMHFPGFAKQNMTGGFTIDSKIAATGVVKEDLSIQQSFMDYLSTMWKAPRSFLHYNNWFDAAAKDLSGDGLLNVYKSFKKAIEPYGVKMDAMVADDGWQDRKSIWEPSPRYFPNGMADVKLLRNKLKKEGVDFGLWLSISGYTNNIDWGKAAGYAEAVRNEYFSQYGRYYSLSADKYKNEVMKKIPAIAKELDLVYYKHDFNDLSDKSTGNNHPGTDRHGHEANLDAQIDVLLATRAVKPDIIQNLTNWVWFSPYWLVYSDYLWLLAGDDGMNANWPELSKWAMKSTDRDAYFARMWGNAGDRPLVPISRIMTHGIVKTGDASENETLQDWMDYALMHYGRGTLLKEWYISAASMTDDEWKVLCLVDNWAKKHRNELNKTFYVGGRPDEGAVYGYIGWEGKQGVLTVRNPAAETQTIRIPFNETVGFSLAKNMGYHAQVVYPYHDQYAKTFTSGKVMEIEVPGYSTMALEFREGAVPSMKPVVSKLVFKTEKGVDQVTTKLQVPVAIKDRAELLVIGWPHDVQVRINGEVQAPSKSEKAKLNAFAGYAKAGMILPKAKDWRMNSFDLMRYKGQEIEITYNRVDGFESHVLLERKVVAKDYPAAHDVLWPLSNDTRRQTVKLF